ncbi:MAG: ammonium transporter, partial [archaeon]|nr:ammonium transporter [archaeon]
MIPRKLIGLIIALTMLPFVSATPTIESVAGSIDTVWILLAAFLVFFMQAGFAMVESGFTRAKNTANIMMKNAMDFAIGSIGYFAIGFAIMFSATGLIDPSKIFLANAIASDYAFWMFQVMFAATAATIVSGAMAERTRFSSYLLFSFIITAIIYPIVGNWIWGGGWLAGMTVPFIDFAGSTVVHSTGGWAALAGAIVVGPRIGKYVKGKSVEIKGHSLPLATLGVFILWFGWYGFNAGS